MRTVAIQTFAQRCKITTLDLELSIHLYLQVVTLTQKVIFGP